MKKKLFIFMLVTVLAISILPVCAETPGDITVYLSISKYGEFVTGKDDTLIAGVPIVLSGRESYNLDDLFNKAHELYYPGDEPGYASSETQWGLGMDMLWGDTSTLFGYYVNRASAMGLGDTLSDGDNVDAFINKSEYPDNEGYSSFDAFRKDVYLNEEVSLTLSYESGFENWIPVVSLCEGATVTIDGEETELLTDENGSVTLTFDALGKYVVSAKKDKILDEQSVPAITAPVCIINVTEDPADIIVHNIAKHYTESDIESAEGNLQWIAADMAVYEKIFPESEFAFSEQKKSEILEKLVEFASAATRPGDLAKTIIALRAMGYDVTDIYTKDFLRINLVESLLELVDAEDSSVTNIYTLPYVIIALSQSEEYATGEQTEYLLNAAITSKESWQNVSEGTDALTPIILALAPFADENEDIALLIDESVEILKSEQRDDGLIDGFEGYEPASTGLAICAFSSVGITEVNEQGKTLVEGLLSVVNEDYSGFANAFATEQAFRGLLSIKLYEESGKRMYDFSDVETSAVDLSGVENCPVKFVVTPSGATVTIEGAEQAYDNVYDLPEGVYSYTVSADRYKTKSGDFEVTSHEAQNKILKTIDIKLTKKNSGGGGSYVPKEEEPVEDPEETVPETENPGDITEESDKPGESTEKTEPDFADVKKDDWFYGAVCFVSENGLINGTNKGFEPYLPMTRAMLVTVLHRYAKPEFTSETGVFVDVPENAWYAESVNWAAANGIVSGISEQAFAPDKEITREQLAVILYRFSSVYGYDLTSHGELNGFTDADNVSDYALDAMKYAVGKGLIGGTDKGELLPENNATRAEVAAIIMRFVQEINK